MYAGARDFIRYETINLTRARKPNLRQIPMQNSFYGKPDAQKRTKMPKNLKKWTILTNFDRKFRKGTPNRKIRAWLTG